MGLPLHGKAPLLSGNRAFRVAAQAFHDWKTELKGQKAEVHRA